jgi:hypothetical protein
VTDAGFGKRPPGGAAARGARSAETPVYVATFGFAMIAIGWASLRPISVRRKRAMPHAVLDLRARVLRFMPAAIQQVMR